MNWKLIIYIACYMVSLPAFSADITGVVTDTDKKPIAGAQVTLLGDSVNVAATVLTDSQGRFSLNADGREEATVAIACFGYESQRIEAPISKDGETDIGTVRLQVKSTELEEVEVVGSSVIEKPDRYVIMVSDLERERASEPIDLLNELKSKMPGLFVNTVMNKIEVEGQSPVFQINGREVSSDRVLGLNKDDILRIEYRNTPDIRYADRGSMGVINFILRPNRVGGYVSANAYTGLTTPRVNAGVNAAYSYKKSEFTLNYTNITRKSTHEYEHRTEQYNSDGMEIDRQQTGLPSSTRDFSNNLSLDYTYMHDDKTMFAATLSSNFGNYKQRRFGLMTETVNGENSSTYEKFSRNYASGFAPTLNLYFRKDFNERQSFELNATGNLSSYDQLYSNQQEYLTDGTDDYSLVRTTDANSYAASIEALYSQQFDNVTMQWGAKYTRNKADNDYEEDGELTTADRLTSDRFLFHGSVAGRKGNLGYTFSAGGEMRHSANQEISKTQMQAKVNATVNYRFAKRWSLNYLLMLSPTMPSLSLFSTGTNNIDDISVRQGNMDISPSFYLRNRVYLRYELGKLRLTGWASYSHTFDPILSSWNYDNDPTSAYYGKFITRVDNGTFEQNTNFVLDVSYQNLFNHLTIGGSVGWDQYKVKGGGYDYSERRFYSYIWADAYFGNFSFSTYFDIARRYSLSGGTISEKERFDYIAADYRWRNFTFGVQWYCPINKDGLSSRQFSKNSVRPFSMDYHSEDFSNMVLLKIVYKVNFGKMLQKSRRNLKTGNDLDSGVLN